MKNHYYERKAHAFGIFSTFYDDKFLRCGAGAVYVGIENLPEVPTKILKFASSWGWKTCAKRAPGVRANVHVDMEFELL